MNKQKNKALRYNNNKTRYSLLPPITINKYFYGDKHYNNEFDSIQYFIFEYMNGGSKELLLEALNCVENESGNNFLEYWADVLTFGANKYSDDNWRNGFSYRSVIDSLLRHLYSYQSGNEIDDESKLNHLGHIACNLSFLHEFHYIYPQGDDRPHLFNRIYKIGLDIDGVLADFWGAVSKLNNYKKDTKCWLATYDKKWLKLFDNKKFWVDLKATDNPNNLLVEPVCYITNRPNKKKLVKQTKKWMEKNNFPSAPIYFVKDKVKIAKELDLDIFVDDNYDNFQRLNNAGIKTYLYTLTHNEKYDVGDMRINNLNDLNEKLWSR